MRVLLPGDGANFGDITVTITPENDAPIVSAPDTLSGAENATDILFQASALDPDGTTSFVWSLAGDDATRFTIDAAGAVRFRPGIDFESPTDNDGDGVYDILIRASDGLATAEKAVSITVTDVAEAPVIAGLPAFAAFAEEAVNAAPRLLFPNARFTLGDDLDGALLTIGGLLPEDRVTVLAQGDAAGQIGFDGSSIRFGGIVIGTATGGQGAPFQVRFNDAASAASTQALLGRLAFADVSDTPTLARSISVEFVQANGKAASPPGYAAPANTAALLAAVGLPANVGEGFIPVAGDLDGDGRADLIFLAISGAAVAYRNTEAGFVALPGAFAAPYADFTYSPTLLDVDGDGRADYVFSVSSSTPLYAARNTGAGFVFDGSLLLGSGLPYMHLAAGDLDRDGDRDILGQGTTTIAFADNGPGFDAYGVVAFAGGPGPGGGRIAVGDLDGDGWDDMVAVQPDGRLATYRNTGTGLAAFTVAGVSGVDVGDAGVAFIDLTGDGRLDLLIGRGDGSLMVLARQAPPGTAVLVTPSNDAPTGPAIRQLAPVPEDGTRVITAAELLAGWTDADGDGLVLGGVTLLPGSAGTLTAGLGGTWTYQPAANAHGTLAFTYTVGDGTAEVQASATLGILAQNDVPTGGVMLGVQGGALVATPDIADADGLGAVTLHWQALVGGTWTDIAGATGPAFAPATGSAVQTFRAVARYTDGGGTAEEVATTGTAKVGTFLGDRLAGGALPGALLGQEGSDHLTGDTGAESLLGGAGRDSLAGNGGADLLDGGAGADTLSGGDGNDTLLGGPAADALSGGTGADVFRFLLRGEGGDTIADFAPGIDRIEVLGSAFGNLVAGALGAARFSTGAPIGNVGQFLYDGTTGALSFDTDGIGAKGAALLATLTGAPALAASDILVIA